MLGWVREVFAGMAERALPGETRAVWEREGDGEVRRYEVWASPVLPPEVAAFPGARQAVRLVREVVVKGTGEVWRTEGYALTSLGPNEADAGVLGRLWVGGGCGERVFLGAGRAFAGGCFAGAGARG